MEWLPALTNQMRFNTNSCGYLGDKASWLVPQRSLHPTPELKNLHDNLTIGRSPFKWLVTTLNLSFTEFATFFGSVQTEHMRNMHMSIVKNLCISWAGQLDAHERYLETATPIQFWIHSSFGCPFMFLLSLKDLIEQHVYYILLGVLWLHPLS